MAPICMPAGSCFSSCGSFVGTTSVHEKNITLCTTTKNQQTHSKWHFVVSGTWARRHESSRMIFAKSLGLQLGIFVGTVVGRQASSSHTQQIEFRWNSEMQYEHLPTSNNILLLHDIQPCTGAIHFSISYEDCLTAILGICIAKMHIASTFWV